jgi:adenylyltransferase/sulfurtransferase
MVEFDTVEKGNLQRQTLFTTQQEGHPKIEAAAGRLQALNPSMHLEQFNIRLHQDNADDLIRGYDVVVDCSDNFQTRYLINDVCGRLKTPVVYGAISDYEGQVMVLHHHRKADLRDIYPELPETTDDTKGIMPTLPHITGTIQANETIKLLTGKGRLLDGEMLLLNVFSNDYHIIEL